MKATGHDRLTRLARLPGARVDLPAPPVQQDLAAEATPERPKPESTPTTLVLDGAVVADLRQSANEMATQLKQALVSHGDSQERFAEMLSDAIKTGMGAMEAKAVKPKGWVFTVKRDVRGLIETIEAKAK